MKTFKRNLEILTLAVAIVFVWRGVWGLTDVYLFPASPTLSFVTSIAIGVILLLLIGKKKNDIGELL